MARIKPAAIREESENLVDDLNAALLLMGWQRQLIELAIRKAGSRRRGKSKRST